MAKIIFILGGTRSGKSRYAVELAKKFKKKVTFIATCIFSDKEMQKKIRLHQILRPRAWKLVEEGKDIYSILVRLRHQYSVVLIDCLGLWISNLLVDKSKDKEIEAKINNLIDTISKARFTTILVSNEVGCGIVPENNLARRFGDLMGLANQRIAKKADEVIFMVSGIPIKLKNSREVNDG